MKCAERFSAEVTTIRRSHPKAPAMSVLELVFKGSSGLILLDETVHPSTPLGQVIAEAFDRGMSSREWVDWTGPGADPSLSAALMEVWRSEVLGKFCQRLAVSVGTPGSGG